MACVLSISKLHSLPIFCVVIVVFILYACGNPALSADGIVLM